MTKKSAIYLSTVLFLSMGIFAHSTCAYAQNEVSEEEQASKAYTQYKAKYYSFRDTKKEIQQSRDYENALELSEYYHNLGKKFEDLGRLKEAEFFYKRSYKIISSEAPKRYMLKRDAGLKSRAKIYRSRSKSTLKKHKKELERLEKEKSVCISKLEKWLSIRARKNSDKVTEENAKNIEKIASLMTKAEEYADSGKYKKSISNYRKAFNISKDLTKKGEILNIITSVFDKEIDQRTALIKEVEILNISGDNHYKYEEYENAYEEYYNAYDLLVSPEKHPTPVSMKVPSLP